jgi:hypothetical protein
MNKKQHKKLRTLVLDTYATKWFKENGYTLHKDGESYSLAIDGYLFELSEADISYRAELYLESEREGLRCTRV